MTVSQRLVPDGLVATSTPFAVTVQMVESSALINP
jgi:hypothetical protein